MIKLADADHFEFIFDLYMHPMINPFLLYEFMDRTSFAPIFEKLVDDRILYVYGDSNTNFGMFKFIPLQHRTSHIAYLGGLAIHPDFAGQGHGASMISEILPLAKSMDIKRIELSTGTHNPKAVHLYEKMGFQREGVLRNYTFLKSENRFVDEILMSYLFI